MGLVEGRDYDDIANKIKMVIEGSGKEPKEELVRGTVENLAPLYDLNLDEVREVINRILAKFRHSMSEAISICEKHEDWYLQARANMKDYRFETRCIKYLLSTGLSSSVVNQMDNWTRDIMNHLGDPRKGSFFRKGLVMGDVQSGKTNTYLMLCNKAADVGYKVMIILTTNIENLRVQTQRRVDYTMVGYDSDDMLTAKKRTTVGVSGFGEPCTIQPFTSQMGDFNRKVARNVPYHVGSQNVEPCVFVVKKENKILRNLDEWLQRECGEDGKINQSLLMIDDEADYASVNTKREDASRINSRITSILGMFTRASYCGFTATPFANIFIDPDKPQDLFPSDFITCMGRSDNYIGPDKLFSGDDLEDESDTAYPRMIQVIRFPRSLDKKNQKDEGLDELKLNHDKEAVMNGIPDSLLTAIYEFLLTCAIRDIRGDSCSHMSMMINMSRFTNVQNNIGEQVDGVLKEIVQHISLYSKMDMDVAMKDRHLMELGNVFEEQYGDLEVSWEEVMSQLNSSVQPIKVMTVNQKSIEPIRYKSTPMRVIAVGGNSLSRGLTLEGLVVSYFYRNSRTYDTLMQMGRWFGYHDRYEDLCRVWMTEESIEWYTYINRATENLREQFYRMASLEKTPEDFGILVENDLTSLQITSRNKMYDAGGVRYMVKSVAGKMIDTPYFYANLENVRANHQAVNRAIEAIEKSGIHIWHNLDTGNYVWKGVPRRFVRFLVESIEIPDNNDLFDKDTLLEQISDDSIDSLSEWDVAVVSRLNPTGVSGPFTLRGDGPTGAWAVEVNMPVRSGLRQLNEDDDVLKVIKGKLVTPADVAEGLYKCDGTYNKGLKVLLEDAFRKEIRSDGDYSKTSVRETAYLTPQAKNKRPLILVYFIDITKETQTLDERVLEKAKELDGLPPVGFAVAYPSSEDLGDAQSKVCLRYRANKVYERYQNLYLPEDDE